MQYKWHNLKIQAVLKSLDTTIEGLSKDELSVRRGQYGKNALPVAKGTSLIVVIIRQFTGPLMLVLIGAIIASLLVGEHSDAIVIALAVLVNGAVGFIQEWKAERAAEALKSFEVQIVRVRRGGETFEIDAKELVPGDIVLLTAGARVPADMRLLSVNGLLVDESLLTGESYPVEKVVACVPEDSPLAERANMVYMGTTIKDGKGEAVVVAIGSLTRLGDIARLVGEVKDEETPLQKQLSRFGKMLGVLVLFAAGLIFVLGLSTGSEVKEMLTVSIALAVAAIPEGLLVALTVILAIGMQRMLKRKALVRRLVAAETLGSVSVVCTDKTGTLTEGSMTAVRFVAGGKDVTREEEMPKEVHDMLMMFALNNDAEIHDDGSSIGLPTEVAMLEAARIASIDIDSLRGQFPRTSEIPFSSRNKYMATLHRGHDDSLLIVKGAPEVVLEMCADSESKEGLASAARRMAEDGLRVLMVATRDGGGLEVDGLNPVGLIGIKDPLRASARQTVEELKGAGVRVVVITGDHPDTALNIALGVGVTSNEQRVVTGSDLDSMTDEDLLEGVAQIDVYARVEPHHKVRIVNAWKKRGEVVAMVGDGVNDAAALKTADIGVSVGSGSDVTKQTSDMVLLDNNISTIGAAVKEGRVIFDNIRKVVVYLMTDSFSEMVLIGGSLLLGIPLPITAAQILWINLITDGLPNIALTMEPGEKGVMKDTPRPLKERVVNGEMKTLIFIIGIITDIGLFGMYFYFFNASYDMDHLRTLIFTALAIDSLLYVFAVRSLRTSIFRNSPFGNPWLVVAVLIAFIVQLAAVYVPALQGLLSTVPLNGLDWTIIIILGIVKLVFVEITKEAFIYLRKRRAHATQA